jgi:hypothetical protein
VTTSTLFNALRVYLGTGLNILTYNPTASFTSSLVSSLDVSKWLTNGRVYDLNSIYEGCKAVGCFVPTSACSSQVMASSTASTAERQNNVATSASVSGTYLGVTGSLSSGFSSSQSELSESTSLSVSTSGDCALRRFALPSTARLSQAFLTDVGAVLDALASAKGQTSNAAKDTVAYALNLIYNSYGTHVPQALSLGGFFRMELLLDSSALATTYKTKSELNVGVQHALASFSTSVGTNSSESSKIFSSTSRFSVVMVPPSATLPVETDGGGYKINGAKWAADLINNVTADALYPSVGTSQPLDELFRLATATTSITAKLFGTLTQTQMQQMSLLSKAYLAYVINNPSIWPTELPMPQLLNSPNYLGMDGKCVRSPLVVRVNQKTDYGASFKCITCMRDVQNLLTDRLWSKHNPEYTAKCTIGQDGSLASIKGECKPCDACTRSNNELCLARGGGYTGMFTRPETCDSCQECVGEKDCGNVNGYGTGKFKYGNTDLNAQCYQGKCVQCLSSKRCANFSYCDTAKRTCY